jgi:hypothetical protein
LCILDSLSIFFSLVFVLHLLLFVSYAVRFTMLDCYFCAQFEVICIESSIFFESFTYISITD